MVPTSFSDELTKIAAPAAFLATLGKFFGENIPSMLGSLRGSTMANVGKARMIGGAVGAGTGMFTGSRAGDTPEAKSRDAMLGAIGGGMLGAIGLGKIAPKVRVFGAKASTEFGNLGKYMNRPGATVGSTVDYAAKNLNPQFSNLAGKPAPTMKTFFGLGPETKAVSVQTSKPSLIGGTVGEIAQSAKTIKDAPNVFSGVAKALKQNWEDSKFVTRNIDGQTYKFQRSAVGRVVNPLLTSGVGFGALEAATTTNEDGSKPNVGKRLLRGGTTALAWGTAPRLMFGKALAYDVPKTLIGMKKQQTGLPKQI